LLRIIAGLETADAGTILFSGEDTTHVHVRERQVGFVFQHYALFRHMTVFENVAFGLRVRPKHTRPTEAAIQKKVHDLLNLVQLDWLGDRYPSQLSGGQRQRIALARALAVEPRVLLLDEPFGALDAKVRKDLRRWLRRLHDDLDVTSIFVTHDQEEALEVADRVVLMNKGKVEQIGSPDQVYEKPATPFVYGFLGNVNLFHGRVDGDGIQVGEHNLQHSTSTNLASGTPVVAFARPHELEIVDYSACNYGVAAKIDRILSFGVNSRIELSAIEGTNNDGLPQHFEVELSKAEVVSRNLTEGLLVRIVPSQLKVFDNSSQVSKV
jgi:sulfate transport system ATP-binding protein